MSYKREQVGTKPILSTSSTQSVQKKRPKSQLSLDPSVVPLCSFPPPSLLTDISRIQPLPPPLSSSLLPSSSNKPFLLSLPSNPDSILSLAASSQTASSKLGVCTTRIAESRTGRMLLVSFLRAGRERVVGVRGSFLRKEKEGRKGNGR